MIRYSIGDKVRLLNEVGEGVITAILSDYRVEVELSDGFVIEYSVKQLVPVKPIRTQKKEKHPEQQEVSTKNESSNSFKDEVRKIIEKKKIRPDSKSSKSTLAKSSGKVEVDLHIEELLDNTKGMTSHEKLVYQLNVFKKTVHAYKNNKGYKIIFVHGKGNGRLKAEIRSYIDGCDWLSYEDASYRMYGTGATEVLIR